MLFERRDTCPAVVPRAIQCWNRRQARQHQYTPPPPRPAATLHLATHATTTTTMAAARRMSVVDDANGAEPTSADTHHDGGGGSTGTRRFEPTMNANTPADLPKSYRRLQWEKRTHCAQLSTFGNKITGAPSPQEREALQQLFERGAQQRREVSHEALRRRIMGHQRAI